MRGWTIADELWAEFYGDTRMIDETAVQVMQRRQIAHGDRHVVQTDIVFAVKGYGTLGVCHLPQRDKDFAVVDEV